MKTKTYIFLFFLIISNFGFGQSAVRKQTISSSFSPLEIEAYQESADKKIEDFYSYLNLLSDKSISEKTKAEIRENIFLLFKNKRVGVIDFLYKESGKISLSELLDMVENLEINFNLIQKKETLPELFSDYWLSEYSVEVEINGEKSLKKVTQKIYFSPKGKKFGSTYKEVWEIKLGETQ